MISSAWILIHSLKSSSSIFATFRFPLIYGSRSTVTRIKDYSRSDSSDVRSPSRRAKWCLLASRISSKSIQDFPSLLTALSKAARAPTPSVPLSRRKTWRTMHLDDPYERRLQEYRRLIQNILLSDEENLEDTEVSTSAHTSHDSDSERTIKVTCRKYKIFAPLE